MARECRFRHQLRSCHFERPVVVSHSSTVTHPTDKPAARPPSPRSRARTDDATIARAEAALARLLRDPGSDTHQSLTTEVDSALRAVRVRLEDAATLRRDAAALAVAPTESAHARAVDAAIIDTKIRAGDAALTKESMMRDLARARRALRTLDGEEELKQNAGHDAVNDGLVEEEEEEELKRLQQKLEEETKWLYEAEKELVTIVDEMGVVRNKRAELERKMKNAEEEW